MADGDMSLRTGIKSFVVESKNHVIVRETSRAECEAACRIDWLSAGPVGRLGVTFNARRSGGVT